ncbi:MAG: polysaccharide export protein [Pelosinus sp.]|nr:polysaccharide export protein [Pelosinus sp.]
MGYKRGIIFFLLLLLGIECAAPVLAADPNPAVVAQLSQPSTQASSDYRLSKYDVLNIVIMGFSDTHFTNSSAAASTAGLANGSGNNANVTLGANDIMIGPDGYVNLPYAGSVKLAGLTIPEATDLLSERLGEYIRIPGMTIIVKQYGMRKVYVMGEVSKQGIYALSSEYMNVFAAISSAGGISKRGRPKHIAVVRMVDGKMQMQEVNFDRFIQKHDGSQNLALQDGDMVYVPRSNKIDLNEDIMPLVNSFAVFRSLTN